MNEATHLLEEGIATAEDIDTAIKYGLGFRLSVFGLLEFIDMGGLDILYYADRVSLFSLQETKNLRSPKLIEEKMKKGEMGPRAGKGIYDYDRGTRSRLLFEERYEKLLKLLRLLERRRATIDVKRVAVLGRGNGAFAMASDLALQGFEVRMWSKPFDELEEIQKTHTINVSGPLIHGEAKISS